MLTKMSEDDWAIVMEVFDAVQSRRGEPGHDDRKFLEAVHYFTVHNITWRALPAEFGPWNSVWKPGLFNAPSLPLGESDLPQLKVERTG